MEARNRAEGVFTDERDDVMIAQRRKRQVVQAALPRFLVALWSVVDEGSEFRMSGMMDGPKGGSEVALASLGDPTQDPMFKLYVQLLSNEVVTYMTASAKGMSGGASSPALIPERPSSPHAARDAAFDHFTKHSRRYLELLLEYLRSFVSVDYLSCNCYLILALTKTLDSRRPEILAPRSSSNSRSLLARLRHRLGLDGQPRVLLKHALMEQVAADDARVFGLQCAFGDFGAAKLLMSLLSLAELSLTGGSDDEEFYFQQMVPQVVEFGNALLWGGNTRVQGMIFDKYLEMKQSVDAFQEETFLRSLQQQLRGLRSELLHFQKARDLHKHGHMIVRTTPLTTTASVDTRGRAQASTFASDFSPQTAALLRVQQRAIGLLLLVQNLVEGHNRQHQEFLCVQPGVRDTVNLVKEIGGLYMALFEHIEPELQLRTVVNSSEGGATISFRVPAWDRIKGFDRLRVTVPVLAQALRTMQELCQGPCSSNQLALVRCGVCDTFAPVLAFAGALQERRPASDVLRRRVQAMHPRDANAFRATWERAAHDVSPAVVSELAASTTDASVVASSDASTPALQRLEVASVWLGSDPVLTYLMTRLSAGRAAWRDNPEQTNIALGTWPQDCAAATIALAERIAKSGITDDDNDKDDDDDDDDDGNEDGNHDEEGSAARPEPRPSKRFYSSGNLLNTEQPTAATPAASSVKGGRRAMPWCDSDGREGGWLAQKEAFVALRSGGAPWQANVYRDVERVVEDFFGLEAALLVFMQSLVDGADTTMVRADPTLGNEVAEALSQTCFPESFPASLSSAASSVAGFGQRVEKRSGAITGASPEGLDEAETPLLSVAINWMGMSMRQALATSVKHFFFEGNALHAAAAEASAAHDMSLSYYILLESMHDVGVMPPAVEGRYRALMLREGLEPSADVGRVEVMGKDDNCSVLYFPLPLVVRACWERPEVARIRNQILFPADLNKRGNPEEKIKNFLDESEELIDIMNHEFMLMEKRTGKGGRLNALLAMAGQQYYQWSTMQLILSLAINGALLCVRAVIRRLRCALHSLLLLVKASALCANRCLCSVRRYFVGYDESGSQVHGFDQLFEFPFQGRLDGFIESEWWLVRRMPHVATLLSLHLFVACLALVSYCVGTGTRHIESGLKANPRGALVFSYNVRASRVAFAALKGVLPAAAFDWVGRVVGGMVRANGDGGVALGSMHSSKRGTAQAEITLPRFVWVVVYFFNNRSDWRAGYHCAFVGVSLLAYFVNPLLYIATFAELMRISPTMR